MKIAYIIPRLKDSGLTRIPFWLSKSFYPDNDVKIFYFGDTHPQDKCLNFEAPVQKINFTSFCKDLNNYNIVHSHGLKPDVYVALNHDKINALKITTIHGYHVEELGYDKGLIFSLIFGNLWNLACQKLDLSICISQTMEKYYKNLGIKNIITIYNGIGKININNNNNKDLNKREDWQTPDDIRISTVSILNKRKGVDQIIKLLQLNKRCHLIAIGGKTEDISRLQRLAEKLEVFRRCTFTEFQKNPWKIAICSDVFIFPSRSEGFGLALVEAASLEIPIICSDIPTFREIFNEDEVTFFTLDDIDDLNEKILKLDEIRDKAHKAKLKVEKKFTIENMCYDYYQEYKKLIDAN